MKKRFGFIAVLLVLVFLFAGCSASSNGKAVDYYAPASSSASYYAAGNAAVADEAGWGYEMGEPEYPEESSGESVKESYGGHKIIKSASMEIRTKNFDEDLAFIKNRVAELGGYVSSSSINGTKPQEYGDSGRNAYITVRVPQDKLDTFMDDARGIAEVTNEEVNTVDITAQYIDTDARLTVCQTKYDRLVELLKEAKKMEDIIVLESELSDVTYEIESLTSTLRHWDDLVDFSDVTISLYERNVFAPYAGTKPTIWTRMGEGFMDSLGGVVTFFGDFLVWFVSALPVLVVLAIIAVIVVLIVRASMKKSRAKRAARMQAMQAMPPRMPVTVPAQAPVQTVQAMQQPVQPAPQEKKQGN